MAAQEKRHLDAFDALLGDRRVRPTALQPLWHVAGYALGAATALLGREGGDGLHRRRREGDRRALPAPGEALPESEAELKAMIESFRQTRSSIATSARPKAPRRPPAYPLLTGAIKTGSRLAIWLGERV